MKRSMPWYMFPKRTCQVLNKVASRVLDQEGCKDIMDRCTMMLWSKQENYYKGEIV